MKQRLDDLLAAGVKNGYVPGVVGALPSKQQFIVRGAQGQISTESGESFTTWNEASSLLVNDVLEEFPVTNAFVEMVENVSQVIEGSEGWFVSSADSIRVAHILDAIAATTL